MKEKALVLAICMACASPVASLNIPLSKGISSLNLGEIESNSRVGESFEGMIPFLSTTNKQTRKLKVSLAPSSIYKNLGRKKSPVLRNFNFKIINTHEKPTILIQSKQAINTKTLELILKIENSQSVIYQYYKVVLTPEIKPKTIDKMANSNAIGFIKNKSKTVKYVIKQGDSLSKISQRFKSNQISLNRMMEAIHVRNPDAFTKNDINRIESGKILYIPTLEETKKITITLEKKRSSEAEKHKNTQRYTVKKGDSLSKITRNLKISGVSFTKVMTAIYKENPHAFSKNRINILKVNSVLTIPTFKHDELVQNNITPLTQTKISNESFKVKRSLTKKIVADSEIQKESTDEINALKAELDTITETISTINQINTNNKKLSLSNLEKNTPSTKESNLNSPNEKVLETFNFLSAQNLSYASLALILSLLLVRKRKQENLKTAPVRSVKEEMSTEDIITSLRLYKEDQSNNNSSISEINLSKNALEKHKYLSAKEIHECEVLVNELINELEENQSIEDDSQLYSTHNQQIEAILNNKDTGFDEFMQENIALIAKINGMGKDAPETNKPLAQQNNKLPNQAIDKKQSDIALFKEKMYILAELANTDNDTTDAPA